MKKMLKKVCGVSVALLLVFSSLVMANNALPTNYLVVNETAYELNSFVLADSSRWVNIFNGRLQEVSYDLTKLDLYANIGSVMQNAKTAAVVEGVAKDNVIEGITTLFDKDNVAGIPIKETADEKVENIAGSYVGDGLVITFTGPDGITVVKVNTVEVIVTGDAQSGYTATFGQKFETESEVTFEFFKGTTSVTTKVYGLN